MHKVSVVIPTYNGVKYVTEAIDSILNQPIRLPGLKPGVCSGLILSGAFYPDLKIGVWRRRTYQTYKDFEIIVVDNGSSDKTIDVLKSYGTKINWISQKHSGVSAARNTGMHLAQGTYYLGAYVKRYDFEKDLDTKFPAATITVDSNIGVSGTANLYPIFRVKG